MNLELKKVIKSNNFSLNDQDEYGRSLLHYAVVYHDMYSIGYLVYSGINLDIQDICGNTALHYACIMDNYDIFDFLIDNGASVDIDNNDGYNANNVFSLYKYCNNGLNIIPLKYDPNDLSTTVVFNDDCDCELCNSY